MGTSSYDPDDDPPIRLDSWLDLHVANYERDFKAYWGTEADACPEHLTFEEWQEVCELSKCFDSLLGSLKELSLNPRVLRYAENQVEFGNPLHALPDLACTTYVKDRIQIAMAYDALARWSHTRTRAEFLTLMLGKVRLSEVAQGYVRRTTELYLWGFDLEAMIMASGVLEQAIARELEDAPLEQFGMTRLPNAADWAYWQLIDGAAKLGIFTEKQQMKAHELRLLRNQLLHDLAFSKERIEEVLWVLYELLAVLMPARGHLAAE